MQSLSEANLLVSTAFRRPHNLVHAAKTTPEAGSEANVFNGFTDTVGGCDTLKGLPY
jgi:hypothetical protein